MADETLNLLQSGLAAFAAGQTQPFSYAQLPRHQTAAGELLDPFAGQATAKQAHEAACQHLNTNFAHLKGLRARLSAPGRQADPGSSSAGVQVASSSGSALLRSRLTAASAQLQESIPDLRECAPEASLVEQLGGCEEQLQEVFTSAQTKLDAHEVQRWFAKLKQQRQVVLDAAAELQWEPVAGEDDVISPMTWLLLAAACLCTIRLHPTVARIQAQLCRAGQQYCNNKILQASSM